MNKLTERLFFSSSSPPKFVEPGLYHFMKEADGTFTRFHLRVDPDGRGMLLANATAAARLSPSGVIIAKGKLEGDEENEILNQLKRLFKGASNEVMLADLEQVEELLSSLSAPGDNYPIINLEDADISPFEAELMAPFQADIQLAPPESLVPIFNQLWNASIPHVTIHVPENPIHEHLVRAVERAEDLGMIAGVRGRATDLSDDGFLEQLAEAGLDHLNVLYASAEAAVHDALCGEGDHVRVLPFMMAIQENEVAPVAEVPLVGNAIDSIEETIEQLLSVGVYNVNFLAIAAPDDMPADQRDGALPASAMPQTADLVEEIASESAVRFIWQPPVLRDPAVSLVEQVRLGPRCSADVSIRVEPDGSVIPARGPYRVAGNILHDDWQSIWSNEAFVHYRTRVERPTHCDDCPDLAICGADCPKKIAGWSQGVRGTI